MPRQFYVKGKRILAYARPEGDRRGVTARFAAKKGGGEVELELEPGVYQAPSLLGIHIVHNLILGSPSAQRQSDVWKLMEP